MNIHRTSIFLTFVFIFWPFLLFAQAKPEAAQFFQRAADQSDFMATGGPPFDLDATFQITDAFGKKFHGAFHLAWAAADRWREEIVLGPYSRVRVCTKGKYWQKRSIDYELPQIYQLSEALHFVSRLRDIAAVANKTKREKAHGLELNCAQVHPADEPEEELCFDVSSGTLNIEKFPRGSSDGQSEVTSREFSDYVMVGDKLYPKTIRVMAGGLPQIVFSVQKLTTQSQLDETLFAVPERAEPWDTCATPVPPKINRMTFPEYPEAAKMSHVTGSVRAYAVVGTDGFLHNVRILESPSVGLSTASLDALKKREYQPASCNAVPIAQELFVDFLFTINGR